MSTFIFIKVFRLKVFITGEHVFIGRRHDVVDIWNRIQLWSNGRNLTSPSSQEVILPPPSLLTHLHALVSHIIGGATYFSHVLEECSEALLAS
jgi:hypothetical protein